MVVLQESDFGQGKNPNFLADKAREADEVGLHKLKSVETRRFH
jgi:hypothetical protein